MTELEAMTEAYRALRGMMESHDWTFEYSDDHEAWRRGHEQRYKLLHAASLMPRKDIEKMLKEVRSFDSFSREFLDQLDIMEKRLGFA